MEGVLQVLLFALLMVCSASALGTTREKRQNASPTILTPTSGGSIKEGNGKVLTITSAGSVQENGVDLPGGQGSSAATYINGVVYAQDSGSGSWYAWNGSDWIPVGALPSFPIVLTRTSGGSITESNGKKLTITSAGNIQENGLDIPGGQGSSATTYIGGIVYGQDAASGNWFRWDGAGWRTIPILTRTSGGSITETNGKVLTISSAGDIRENGVDIPGGQGSSAVTYINGVVYGQDFRTGLWYEWNNSYWTFFGFLPFGNSAAGFRVANGKILDPTGQPFFARGINVYDAWMSIVSTSSAVQPLLSQFPGTNFVRLNCYLRDHWIPNAVPDFTRDTPSVVATFINQLTAKKIVVVIENHDEATVYSGSNLTGLAAWYANMATAFKDNPYVWFGTTNEPYPPNNSNFAVVTQEQVAIYNAIRGAGNPAPILMQLIGGGNDYNLGIFNSQGLNATAYASMTNIVWDLHYYAGSVTGQQLTTNLQSRVPRIQQIRSADDLVPIIIGEYGISMEGVNEDPGAWTLLQVVQSSGFGCAAWGWNVGEEFNLVDINNNNNNQLTITSYGQEVASWIASSSP